MVTLFGAPGAECDGRPVVVDTRKAVALLAYLALSDGAHRRDRIAGLLWPEYDEQHARAALRRTLSVLNKALGGRWLAIDRVTVGLDRARLWLDVAEFRLLRAQPEDHGHGPGDLCDGCVEALRRAAALQKDDFLAGFALRDSPEFDDWQSWQAETLRRELASVLDDLVRALVGSGRLEEAIASARRRLLLDPLSEPTHRELMRLFAWAGERGAALAQFRECVSMLDRELGVAPLAETADLYEAIRADRLPPPGGSAPAPAPEPPAPSAATPADPTGPFVGRDAELTRAVAAYEERAGSGLLVVIEGEAGIGKTRLAQELSRSLAGRGAVVASAAGREGEANLAFGVVAELLRACTSGDRARAALAELDPSPVAEAARLLPELSGIHGEPPPPLEGPGAHARMLGGVAEVVFASVAGRAPGVVVIDDLHWADPSSVEALGYLLRRLEGRPLCVVVLWRSEEVAPGMALAGLAVDGARRGRAVVLAPGRLTRDDVAALARRSVPDGRDLDGLVDRLFAESEGSPLFLVEYLAALGAGEPVGGLPGGLRALVGGRVRSVDESARQLLGAAAVLGRSFDYDTLRETAGRDEDETVTALERLVARGLVRQEAGDERDGVGFHFTHDKIRSFVYDDMGAPRRRLLHRRAAAALLRPGRAPASVDAVHGLVARHLERAGEPAGAAAHHRLAGHHAASLLALAEALAHFEAALSLEGGDAGDLHEAIGDLHTLQGDYGGALTSFETAAARAHDDALARLEHKLGNVHHRRGNWLAADSHYEAALEKAADDDVLRARVLADRSLTAHRRGDTPTAHAHARAALAVAEETGDDRALAQAHNVLGSIAAHVGDTDEARRHLERSLELAESSADRGARVAALNNLGLVLRRTGDPARALELTRRALTLAEQTGDRHHLAALHNNVADTLHELGRADEAMTHLKQAVALFSDIGGDELEPEIWKLTQW